MKGHPTSGEKVKERVPLDLFIVQPRNLSTDAVNPTLLAWKNQKEILKSLHCSFSPNKELELLHTQFLEHRLL